jgi:hypothetical protein
VTPPRPHQPPLSHRQRFVLLMIVVCLWLASIAVLAVEQVRW